MATIGQPLAAGTETSPRLARGALSLFDTLCSTLVNLAPVEGIFLSITLVVAAMGAQAPWAFLVAYVQRPDALRAAATQGPEFVEDSR